VRGTETIVFTFRSLGKTGEATTCPKRSYAVSAPGQDFMWIGLMAHVPDQFVIRCVEDVVKSDGQFDNTKTRSQVSPRNGNGIDGLGAQFVGNLLQVTRIDASQVGRAPD